MDKVKKELPKSSSKELLEILFEQPYSKIEYLTERLGISRVSAAKYLKLCVILNNLDVMKDLISYHLVSQLLFAI